MTNTPGDEIPMPPAGGETSLLEVINAILRSWRTAVLLPAASAVAFGVLALTKERAYVATATFVPQEGENRNLGRAAALAQQFGVNLDGDRSVQSPQFYEQLLRSQTLLRRAVESQYTLPPATGQQLSGTLVEYWNLKEQGPSELAALRRGVQRLRGAISTNVRRETGVIELRVTTRDGSMSEQIAARLLGLLDDYNLEVRKARAREEGRFVDARLSEALRDVELAEVEVEQFLRQNRNFSSSPELMFEYDRLQRSVLVRQEVYSMLLAAQGQARMDGMRETPMLQIIDSPVGSSEPAPRKVRLMAVLGLMLGLLIAVAVALLREASRNAQRRKDHVYSEFLSLLNRAMRDLRIPARLLPGVGSAGERDSKA